LITYLPVGALGANCVFIICDRTKQAIVVDPGDNARAILREVSAQGVRVAGIVNTHGHVDHIGANGELRTQLVSTGVGNCPLMIHRADARMLTDAAANFSLFTGAPVDGPAADRLLGGGDEIPVGDLLVKVLHTPGHTPGGICLLVLGPAAAGAPARAPLAVLTGDTLFAGSIGRTDFPGGSHTALIRSIREQLLPLPDDLDVYPGHGPQTTIGDERAGNPFLV
jgi:hydroxyacylglutathione hydrolase